MTIEEKTYENHVEVMPAGELDANSSILMDEKISTLLDSGTQNIHINCSKLEYISSAGCGVFLSFLDRLEESDSKMVFSQMSENIYSVFELLGLHQVMTIVKTGEEARQEIEGNGTL